MKFKAISFLLFMSFSSLVFGENRITLQKVVGDWRDKASSRTFCSISASFKEVSSYDEEGKPQTSRVAARTESPFFNTEDVTAKAKEAAEKDWLTGAVYIMEQRPNVRYFINIDNDKEAKSEQILLYEAAGATKYRDGEAAKSLLSIVKSACADE